MFAYIVLSKLIVSITERPLAIFYLAKGAAKK
jgi:hypothetical protein